jgi:hypothetical protein
MGPPRLDGLEDERRLQRLLRTLLSLECHDPRPHMVAAVRTSGLEIADREAEPAKRFGRVINAHIP